MPRLSDLVSPRVAAARTRVLAGSLVALATLAACTRDRASTRPDSTHAPAAGAHPATRPDTTTVTSSGTSSPVSSAHADTSTWRASARGVGAIAFGMRLDSAARVAGGTAANPPGGSCGFVSLRNVPRGARFMVSYDTVVRVDVDSATVPTDAGARVGMSEDSVQRLYANKLRVMPHKYVRGGHYLISIPGAPADTMHQLIFETDGGRVTRYRAGLAPYVSYVEGCG